ncbi:MAG TPA: hypothetical protein VJL89_05975, partial [Thermodesulfovibrionia bacterium]|nr:hypothetical protein [Thermodesulfovibrionia bacterium]
FRSRGYGRGTIEVHWRPTLTLEYANDNCANSDSPFLYFLRALTHFRNKPIEPGRTQLAESIHAVTSSQLRGWFVRTFHRLFGEWPDIKNLNSIKFPNCYPSDNRQLGFFPPFTTQKFANDKSIKDVYQADENKKDEQEQDDNENYIRQKNKPLPPNAFVTAKPDVFCVRSEQRIRNSMESNFTTIENGLFVQQLVHCGTTFGCRIHMDKPDRDFAKKVRFIFDKVHPVINGCIFEPFTFDSPANETAIANQPCLVTLPEPYKADFKQKSNRIMLTTQRRYNTMLQRPRRNRIMIAPGSIITSSEPSIYLMPWNGFGNTIPQPDEPAKTVETPTDEGKPQVFPDKFLKISLSQAGMLREFLNPNHPLEQMKNVIESRLQKYPKDADKGESLIPKGLFEKLLEYLNNGDQDGMKKYIEELMEALFLKWWADKEKEVRNRFEQRKKEKHYE